MEPDPAQSPVEPDRPAVHRLILEFPDGLADITLRAEGVTDAQLYAAAWYLDAVARGRFADIKIAAAIQQAQVAELARGLQNGGRP